MDSTLLQRLALVRHVALDMDGTLYCGDELFPHTQPFLDSLRGMGIGYTFLTNNSSKGVPEYLKHLRKFGIEAAAEDVFTSGHAAISLMRASSPTLERLFVVGTPGLVQELEAAGFSVVSIDEDPQAVLVGFDTALNYEVLCKATYWISRGLPYFATHPDRVCPTNQPTVLLDCGAVCAAIESATGRKPDAIAGKPEPAMLEALAGRHGLHNEEIAMVGDRLYTDIAMAVRAGSFGVLALTGETQRRDLDGAEVQPDLVVENLGELGLMLEHARG